MDKVRIARLKKNVEHEESDDQERFLKKITRVPFSNTDDYLKERKQTWRSMYQANPNRRSVIIAKEKKALQKKQKKAAKKRKQVIELTSARRNFYNKFHHYHYNTSKTDDMMEYGTLVKTFVSPDESTSVSVITRVPLQDFTRLVTVFVTVENLHSASSTKKVIIALSSKLRLSMQHGSQRKCRH